MNPEDRDVTPERKTSDAMARTAGAALVAAALFAAVLAACGETRFATPFYRNTERPVPPVSEELPARDVHAALLDLDGFPSARACGQCHPDHYREWSVSPHAYAQLSPVFNAMQSKIVDLTNGTFGDFCIRCHTPVGMTLGEPVLAPNATRHPVSREGITCVVCHRIDRTYGKVSSRFGLVQGELTDPVYGPSGNAELRRVLADKDGVYGELRTDDEGTGQEIHRDVLPLAELSESGFCGSCHDVTLSNGFRLEEAFSEYKSSPAAAEGTSCQDCHMGKVPGVASGYDEAPAAVVFGTPTRPRKRTNHMFPGPDYSIVHPGLFPHVIDKRDLDLANVSEWLAFDHEAGWGTDEFEAAVREADAEDRPEFPDAWRTRSSRVKARRLLDGQEALLDEYKHTQRALLRAGYQLGDVEVLDPGDDGLRFRVQVVNGTDGHNIPTGFIAERSTWLEVTVTDADGAVVFRSGDRDPNGDVRDLHSVFVHDGALPLDEQLFSLQAKFITRNVRGGEREQVLAVNHSLDPLPFLRPETRSTILTGRPSDARIQRTGIPPEARFWADYEVPAEELSGRGPYTLRLRMISSMVPPNLVHAIRSVGFDYGMTPREVADSVVAGQNVLWDVTLPLAERGRQPTDAPPRDADGGVRHTDDLLDADDPRRGAAVAGPVER